MTGRVSLRLVTSQDVVAPGLEPSVSPRVLRWLARCLLVAEGIVPDGNALTPWLTQRPCRTNAEALRAWVSDQLRADPILAAMDRTGGLSAELAMRLHHHLFTKIEDCHE